VFWGVGYQVASTQTHRHQRHGVVAEDIDDFYRDGVAARLLIGVRRGDQFQFSILAGAEALPLVLEDIATGPAFFEFSQIALHRLDSRQAAFVPKGPRDPDSISYGMPC
jgi:hypothetical protein